MKRIWTFVGFASWLALLAGCNSDSVTGPSPSPEAEFSPASVGETTLSPDSPTDEGTIKIRLNGTISHNRNETLTVCVFNAPYGAGSLTTSYKAPRGDTPLQYVNDTCDPKKIQIDITDKGECPTDPHGWSWLASEIITIPAGKEDCENGDTCLNYADVEILELRCSVRPGTAHCQAVASLASLWAFNVRVDDFVTGYGTQTTTPTTTSPPHNVELHPEATTTVKVVASHYIEGELCSSDSETWTYTPEPEVCELPTVDVLSWKGKGSPEAECAAFGDYVPVVGSKVEYSTLRDDGFYICKAGNDREVWLHEPTGETCRNGKDISHTLKCVCDDAR